MKKSLLILTILLIGLSASAYIEEVSTAPYADKFKPSTGLKIKESNIAAKMENATRDAAYGGKKEEKQWARKRVAQPTQNTAGARSYKWF